MVLITCEAFIETDEMRSAFFKFQLSFEISFTYIFSGLNATLVRASILCMWMLRWVLATRPPIGLTACRRLFQGFRLGWILDTLFWTLSSGSSWWPWRSHLPPCPLLLYLEEIWLSSREVAARVNKRNFVRRNCLNSIDCVFYSPWEVVMNILKQGFFFKIFWLGIIGNWTHQMLSSTHWDQSSWSPHISSTGVDLNRFKVDPSQS